MLWSTIGADWLTTHLFARVSRSMTESAPDVDAALKHLKLARQALAEMGPMMPRAGAQDMKLKRRYADAAAAVEQAYRALSGQ